MGCAITQWWEGEGERPYVIHRARRIWEDCRISLSGDAGLSILGKGTAHGYLRDRLALPSVELVGAKGGREEGQGLETGEKVLKKGGEAADEESVSDAEEGGDKADVAAMLEYVIEEMQPHLYTELLMGLRHG